MTRKQKNKRIIRFISWIVILGVLSSISYLALKYLDRKSAPDRRTEIEQLPEGFISHGIDVSHYQGTIDWDVFNESQTNISFVYCKVSEGITLVDSQWERNEEQLQQLNIKHGGYHFFRPRFDGKEQAKHFLRNYQPKQDDLPPVLDIETIGDSDEQLLKNAKNWMKEVEAQTGRKAVIYTSYNMYKDLLRNEFDDHKFWVANYANRPDRFQTNDIIHWQYNDHGKVAGINTAVDLNFSKIDFTEN